MIDDRVGNEEILSRRAAEDYSAQDRRSGARVILSATRMVISPAPIRTSRLSEQTVARIEFALLALVVVAAFVLRVWGLSRVRFWDEAVYLQNAEVICCGKTNYSELSSRPPLLSLMFAIVFRAWNSVYAACIVTALMNALGPVFLYLGCRKLMGRTAAAIAALLLAFLPYFLGVFPEGFDSDDTGNSLLSDSPALTLICLAFWLLIRALEKQTRGRFFAAGVSLAAVVLMRFACLSTVGLLGLLTLNADRKRQAVLWCGAGFAAGMAPYLCWSRLRYGGFLTTFRNGWMAFEGPGEPWSYYLRHFADIFSWVTIAGLMLILASATIGIASRERTAKADAEWTSNGKASRVVAFLWIWASASLVFFSALRHKEARYIMPAAPAILMLAGLGLSRLVSISGKMRIVGASILVLALGAAFSPDRARFSSHLINPETSDELLLSDFLEKTIPRPAVIYTNENYPVFAYYTHIQIRPLLTTGAALDAELDRLPQNGVVIAYKDLSFGGPPLQRLDVDPHFKRLKEYPRLVAYAYRAEASR